MISPPTTTTEKFMQILAISKPQNVEDARLLHNHRELRARIFSDRLGWDVHVVDGRA
ncbi:hypothetical protein CN177_24435 [Sinorhizobium meliloti]|nr:hypothetical protein CN219_26935 [Sinorhizobium meliloti]RVI35198.1 hypothetical protein CN197_14290 [Sinorhizobium meliloti]RVI40339.1 hypothetical protein CN196_28805 [Sinorhizobium meliloti]RVJ20091.1 hypothetical protein CN177_24435 [Sinorhizobium meliloti]RVK00709.1 hypothetical protein CN170_13005 [Sinorhizobium meliloti]